MKIVRIIARLNVGGPAKHVVWLTEGLRNAGYESVLVAGTVPVGEDDMGYFAENSGVKPVFIPEMSREISVKDLLTVWKLYRLLCRERPDIVHTHTAKAGTVGRIAGLLYRWSTLGALIGRRRQCKLVHTYHGHIFHSYYGQIKTGFFLFVERILARLATDRIVVITEQQREEIHDRFRVGSREQFAVIRLGLDINQFADGNSRRSLLRDQLGVHADEILIGIVGRLTAVKNHELFLRAVSEFKQGSLNSQARQVRFIIIGGGSLRGELERSVENLGLVGDVVFAGNRSDPENFYPALDVVALTSKNEGTPLTLIEAMANGRPVIATAVGGVVDLLGNPQPGDQPTSYLVCQRGISVSVDEAKAFAMGLDRLVNDDALRRTLGESGRRFVEQNYSKQRLLDDVNGLYQELTRPDQPVSVASRSTKRSVESRI
jgi:glycosyltransferase involved in cell wall biosynthesis